MGRLVIDGEQVYELDEECLREKYMEEMKRRKFAHVDTPENNKRKNTEK